MCFSVGSEPQFSGFSEGQRIARLRGHSSLSALNAFTSSTMSARLEPAERIGALPQGPAQDALLEVLFPPVRPIQLNDPKLYRILRRPRTGHLPGKTIEEKLFDRLATFSMHLSKVGMHFDPMWREGLFSALTFLLSADAWDPDDLLPNNASFSSFTRMMIYLNPTSLPALGVSNDGNIQAAWVETDHSLILEFPPSMEISWAYVGKVDGEIESVAGHSPIARLIPSLTPYHPKRWFGHAKEG